jgi:cytoskeletal protein CcmA (bactofilin family)
MEKKSNKSKEEIEKRVIVSSSGDIQEFDEHISTMGSAKISGGKTNKSLRVSGSGKINGDLECNGLTSSGTLTGSGNFTSHGEISSSGSFNIAGFLYGDQDADFSGSTQIGNLVNIQGTLVASGSFEAGHFVRGEQGIQLSGSSEINGNLSSTKPIRIDGSTYIEGNVVGEDILFGVSKNIKKRQHYRVHGSILAKNKVNIIRTHVDGDIKGKEIIIGKGSEVLGNVYYVDSIDLDKKVKLNNEPIQIKIDEL